MPIVLLEGMPGCGKTTLVKRIIQELKNKRAKIVGFYTQELRDAAGERIGFDVHLLDGTVGTLARIGSSGTSHSVGKYKVSVSEFEKLVFPYLKNANENSYLIIDEIGRMELLSSVFKDFIAKLSTTNKGLKILATVPLKTTDPLILRLKRESHQLFHIKKSNRDNIFEETLAAVINSSEN